MKKIYLAIIGVLVLAAIPAVVFAAGSMKANSHAKPPTNIEAEFKFHDNGSILKISGKAEGLTPGKEYVSLVYGVDSLVDGLNSCLPDPFFPNMFVGVWSVAPNGKGTLSATNIASVFDGTVAYVPLTDIGTISVRLVTRNRAHHPAVTATDHRPTIVAVCGKVE